MPVNLSIILLSNSHNFVYYASNFYQLKGLKIVANLRTQTESLTNNHCMLFIKSLLNLTMQQKSLDTISNTQETINCVLHFL